MSENTFSDVAGHNDRTLNYTKLRSPYSILYLSKQLKKYFDDRAPLDVSQTAESVANSIDTDQMPVSVM